MSKYFAFNLSDSVLCAAFNQGRTPLPRTFLRRGELFYRVTILFCGGSSASQVRAYVQDVLHRAHGFTTATGLTDSLAKGSGRFRVPVARRAVKKLTHRLRPMIAAGMIHVFVAGEAVTAD
jgi:hypothetical protein